MEVDSEIASTEAEESAIGHNRFRRRLEERRERYQKSQSPSSEISTSSEAEQAQIAEPDANGIELGISESVITTEQQSEIPEIKTETIDQAERHEAESPSKENAEADIVLAPLEEAVEIEPVSESKEVSIENKIESTHELAALDLSQDSDSASNLSNIAEISEGPSHSSVESDSNSDSDSDTYPSVSDGIQADSPLITEGAESESLIFESSSNAIPDDQDDNEDGPVFSSENETQEDSLFERAILNLHSQKVQIDQTEAVEPSEDSKEPALQQKPEIFEFFQKQDEIPSELGDIFDNQSDDPSEDATSVFADFTESPSVAEEPYSQDVAKTPSLDPALFGGFEMEYAPPAAQAGETNEEGIPVAEFDDLAETDGFTWSEESQQITDEEDQVFEADGLTVRQSAHEEIQENEWETTSLEAGTEIAQKGDEVARDGDYHQSEDQWTEDDYLASEDEDQNWIEENPEATGEVYYEDELDPDALQAQDAEAVVHQGEYDEFQDDEEVAYEDEDEYTEEDQYDSYSEEEDFDDPSADDLSEEQELERS